MTLPTIVSDPSVMTGKPVIAGTRITVEFLLERLAAGESVEEVLRAYPHLPEGSLRAVFDYAAALVRNARLEEAASMSITRRSTGMMGWTGDPQVLRHIAESPEAGIAES